MSKVKSSKSKYSKHSAQASSNQEPLRLQQAKILAPIYDKVALLRQELDSKTPPPTIFMDQSLQHEVKEHFLELEVDRNHDIQAKRKEYQSQERELDAAAAGEGSRKGQIREIGSSMNWRESKRNSTKSLVNFLQLSKSVPNKFIRSTARQNMTPLSSLGIRQKMEKKEVFQPVGEQYLKEKQYQESMKSETFSVTSRQSSIRISKIGMSNSRESSSRKYLRKGTRVREILMRQLQSAEERTSSRASMTYLKEYDQWVPTSLVEEKQAELESFMSIIYGDKKPKGQINVNLDQMQLVYL